TLTCAIFRELLLCKDQLQVTHTVLSDVLYLAHVEIWVITLKILGDRDRETDRQNMFH
ncbi:hypothetical protein GBAR_LOCUS26703, partial [Geodia barretti]